MDTRQCFGLGVVCGVIALFGLVFFRRKETNIIVLLNKRFTTLLGAIICQLLIVGIVLATPITSSQLEDTFFILLIIIGVLNACVGGVGYCIFPETIASRMNTSLNILFQRIIGITYVAFGIMCCIAGGTRDQPLAILAFSLLFCWGYILIIMNHDMEMKAIQNEEEEVDKTSIKLKMFSMETYTNLLIPIILWSIYLAI